MSALDTLKKIKTALGMGDEKKEIKLSTAELEDGTIIEAELWEAGQNVFIIADDERMPLPIGEYTLQDGSELIVLEEGIISEFNVAEAEEEVVEEEVVEEYSQDELLSAVAKIVDDFKSEIKKDVETQLSALTSIKEEADKNLEDAKTNVNKLEKELTELKSSEGAETMKHAPIETVSLEVEKSKNPFAHNSNGHVNKLLNNYNL